MPGSSTGSAGVKMTSSGGSSHPSPGLGFADLGGCLAGPLTGLLPASISDHLSQYLPSYAGDAVWGGARSVTDALSPRTGFAVLCGYAVVLIAAAALRLRRVDA